jgi:hypothetical protein
MFYKQKTCAIQLPAQIARCSLLYIFYTICIKTTIDCSYLLATIRPSRVPCTVLDELVAQEVKLSWV